MSSWNSPWKRTNRAPSSVTASRKCPCQSARSASFARPAPTHSFQMCRSGVSVHAAPSTVSSGRVISLSTMSLLSLSRMSGSALDGAEAQAGLPEALQRDERDDQRDDREQRRRQDEVLEQLTVARGGGQLVPLVDA